MYVYIFFVFLSPNQVQEFPREAFPAVRSEVAVGVQAHGLGRTEGGKEVWRESRKVKRNHDRKMKRTKKEEQKRIRIANSVTFTTDAHVTK